jgi:2'-5' RNA ligase
VRPEGVHLTLKFLGEIPEGSVQPLQAAICEAARGVSPFTVEVGGLGCFPNLTRPRVVWVGVDCPDGSLAEVQKRIEEAAAACGFEREARAFSPHLTLGRVRQGEPPATLRQLGGVVALFPAPQRQRLEVSEVCLFRSVLKPEGAQYTVLTHARLGEPA